MGCMDKVNKKLIKGLLNKLNEGNITLEECENSILKEIQRIEDEWDAELGDMESLVQER